jgi:hypothetical protein
MFLFPSEFIRINHKFRWIFDGSILSVDTIIKEIDKIDELFQFELQKTKYHKNNIKPRHKYKEEILLAKLSSIFEVLDEIQQALELETEETNTTIISDSD